MKQADRSSVNKSGQIQKLPTASALVCVVSRLVVRFKPGGGSWRGGANYIGKWHLAPIAVIDFTPGARRLVSAFWPLAYCTVSSGQQMKPAVPPTLRFPLPPPFNERAGSQSLAPEDRHQD